MDKFKSYLGIAVAIALVWVFTTPTEIGWNNRTVGATPFDETGVSYIVRSDSAKFQLLGRVNRFLSSCPKGVEEPEVDRWGHSTTRCPLYQLAPGLDQMFVMRSTFNRYDKNFSEDLGRYLDLPSGSDEARAEFIRLQERAVATYPEVIPTVHRDYLIAIYFWHLMFFASIVVILIFRRQIGGLVILPITGIGKLLKKAHDQV